MSRKSKKFKKALDKLLEEDPDWIYYKKVEAHRSYMFAMSMYKHMRYGKINVYGNQSKTTAEQNESDEQQRKMHGVDLDKWRWFNIDQ